jgi:hypothetical protein
VTCGRSVYKTRIGQWPWFESVAEIGYLSGKHRINYGVVCDPK